MTLEEKNETLRDLGVCIQEAKRYFDNENDCFSVALGCWNIEFNRAVNMATAALDEAQEPLRNCDRFNTGDPIKDAEDAYGAWQRYCDDPTIPRSCKVESAFKYWLFASTATEREGGAK